MKKSLCIFLVMFSAFVWAGDYVIGGVSQVVVQSADWTAQDGYLEDSSGTSSKFYADEFIGTGDFIINAEISVPATNIDNCSLDFGYKNRIFFSRLGKFSVEGYYLTSNHRQEIEEIVASPVIADTPFSFVMQRTGTVIVISIDGNEVYNRDDSIPPPHQLPFKLRSDDATGMRIYNFSATGDVTAFPNELFSKGEAGYPDFRIPGMITLNNGNEEILLAFAEGRSSSSDTGDIDIVCKRSTDGGQTWSALQTVWSDGENCCGNPCPVVINNGTPEAKIILLVTWNDGSTHESTIKSYIHVEGATTVSNSVRQPYKIESSDYGVTWSEAVNLSDQATQFGYTPGNGDNWNWYATGPGNGIVLESGENAGRIVIPCNHSGDDAEKTYNAHTIYSDDNGLTWKISGKVRQDGGGGPNESCVVELSNGTLIINSRMQSGGYQNRRGIAYSDNCGETWRDFTNKSSLRGPICQASMIRYSALPNTILFLNPQSPDGRYGGALQRSDDGGASWRVVKKINSDVENFSYSAMSELANGDVAIFTESRIGGGNSIVFDTVLASEILSEPSTTFDLPAEEGRILVEFVRNGKQLNDSHTESGDPQQWLSGVDGEKEPYLWEYGTNRSLNGGESAYAIGAGDFRIIADISYRSSDINPACGFNIDGGSFLFDANGNLFTENGLLGSATVGLTGSYIAQTKRFKFEVIRTGEDLEFRIDGVTVLEKDGYGSNPVTVGIRSWRSQMRIYDFYAYIENYANYITSFETLENWPVGRRMSVLDDDFLQGPVTSSDGLLVNGLKFVASQDTATTGGSYTNVTDKKLSGDQSLWFSRNAYIDISVPNLEVDQTFESITFSYLKWTSGDSEAEIDLIVQVDRQDGSGFVDVDMVPDAGLDFSEITVPFIDVGYGSVVRLQAISVNDTTKGFFIDDLSLSIVDKKYHPIGLELTMSSSELSWRVNDELGIAEYQIIDSAGTTIKAVPVDGSGIYTETVYWSGEVRLKVVDKMGFSQIFIPSDTNQVKVIYDLMEGWNLIAMPGENADTSNFVSVLWEWNGVSYEIVEAPTVGKAVWVYSGQVDQIEVVADRVEAELSLETGWNMVGSTENISVPIEATAAYGWKGKYIDITESDVGLLQGVGYWIFTL